MCVIQKKGLPKNKFNYCDRKILHYMYKNPNFSDIDFIVNGKRFPASRFIVSAASEVFQVMLLQGSFQETLKRDIVINDICHDYSFSVLLAYIYDFGIQVDSLSSGVLLEVFRLSHLYGLRNLFSAFKIYISKLSLEATSDFSFGSNSFMELLTIAFTFKIDDLYDRMKVIIKSSKNNLDKFLEHSKFANVLCPILIDLFESDYLYIEEIKILGAALKWIDANTCDKDDEDACETSKDTSEGSTGESRDSGLEVSSYPDSKSVDIDHQSSDDSLKIEENHNTDQSGDCTSNKSSNGEYYSVGLTIGKSWNIEELLKTIRSSSIFCIDYRNYWKENVSLSEKYEQSVSDIIFCLAEHKPRKPYKHARILLECPNYSNKLSYQRTSTVIAVDSSDKLKFRLSVAQNAQGTSVQTFNEVSVQLDVLDFNCNCTQEPTSFKYTIQLKTFHPFKTGTIIIEKSCPYKPGKPVVSLNNGNCSHGYGYGSCPYNYNSACNRNVNRGYCSHGLTSCVNGCTTYDNKNCTKSVVAKNKLPSILIDKNEKFIENDTFVLEAFVEVIN